MRTLALIILSIFSLTLFAASGGPDQYGYIWKDSNEPGGPVYSWIDATINGQQVLGLADDNVVGPLIMATNFPYYWYAPKKLWIGSNGYVAFQDANSAAAFPPIPAQGGANDFIAALMADLNFAGVGNPGECWVLDSGNVTVVSYLTVPFWSATAPGGFDGSNTFQIVLDRADSTITVHYESQTGLGGSNVVLGIESITGDIGIQHSDSLPAAGYSIRYYNPAVPLITITDAACNWLTDEDNAGHMLALGGGAFDMVLNTFNTGSVPVGNFEVVGQVRNAAFLIMASDTQAVSYLPPTTDTTVVFGNQFVPSIWGTYRYIGRVNNIANEVISSNNILEQELIVYDTTQSQTDLSWAGTSDDGVGLGWNGGGGGVAVFIDVPYYPAYVSSTLIRIASNIGVGMHMKVWDDDGPNGSKGTLLDSVFVDGISAVVGNLVVPLDAPFILNDGGLYVSWEMDAAGINIARDIVSPFSLRTYEVLGGVWADYRDRETEDFHLGLRVTQIPISDGGCTAFFGVINGQTVSQPTPVRTWVKNFGNQVISGFDVKYQFDTQPEVTQAFSGSLSPGDSILFIFNQQLDPASNATGDLCSWTTLSGDADNLNDTVCVNISTVVGIHELDPNDWDVAPIPTSSELFITPSNNENYSIQLHDVKAALVFTQEGLNGRESVDLGHLDAGVYILGIEQNGSSTKRRIVVE